MSSQNNCIFCKIYARQVPAKILAENDSAIAFLDAFPLAVGHSLVVPRSHFAKLHEISPEQTNAIFQLVRQVSDAIERSLGAAGSLVAIHNGRAAGQEIPHLHVHIVPRGEGDGAGPVHRLFGSRPKMTDSDLESTKDKIRSSMNPPANRP